MCVPVVEELKKRIGNFVYGVDVETLEELVVSELKKAGKKLGNGGILHGRYACKAHYGYSGFLRRV